MQELFLAFLSSVSAGGRGDGRGSTGVQGSIVVVAVALVLVVLLGVLEAALFVVSAEGIRVVVCDYTSSVTV